MLEVGIVVIAGCVVVVVFASGLALYFAHFLYPKYYVLYSTFWHFLVCFCLLCDLWAHRCLSCYIKPTRYGEI
jgi:hypothetical protein